MTMRVRPEVASGAPGERELEIDIWPSMTVREVRMEIWRAGGVIPALCRLSYAGKNLEDASRSLKMYGIEYWHAKFPHWPLVIREG